MPLYYFVIKHDRKTPEARPSGLELADMDAAWEEATKTTGEIVRDLDGSLMPGSEWSIEVHSATHKLLRKITLITESHE